MLVVLMEDRVLPPCQVCQGCLLADRNGQPRWHHGKLDCGHAVGKLTDKHPNRYECVMGFSIANIN
ncbi:hypothetical protein POG22_18200 [Geitlerinema sp. CS-897]|uniref:hypothetical protein n=1 Tax=Baaleninema simplex TaxID=2862350 RepID=UPI00035D6C8B|nr:hypothetical protein [Baaleninema simplex]MDC0834920.1 hypothetical protein [Geitlerinema sp. CS-897]